MIQKLKITFLFVLLTSFAIAQNSDAYTDYINTYRVIAIEEMQRTGVPASIKLAQGLLESMAGQSELVGKSNNHFGIKCKRGYEGSYVLHDDDRRNEKFMKYESPEQSYKDHSDFLRSKSRYASLFDLAPTDYQAWAYGLKKAGYATNPRYPQLLISLIEKYNLQNYSLIALGKIDMPDDLRQSLAAADIDEIPEIKKPRYPKSEFTINKTKVIFVPKGTSYADIANKYKVPVDKILSYNDFRTFPIETPDDQLVYLQLKRTVGQNMYHEVMEGESIYDIAQKEGIRLESLLKYNNLTKFDSPAIGSKLYLQEAGNKLAKADSPNSNNTQL
ncbi:MAG: glucosaminidase domain-containing protein [Niabella sp.]